MTRFAYDANGRLIGEDQHGHLLRYVYDAHGVRSARITPHRETKYEYDVLGALTRVGAMSILRDGLGRDVGREVGEFVLQRQYDVMGRLQRQAAGPKSVFDSIKGGSALALQALARQIYSYDFAGQWEDEESGLHYNLNRYYDAETGQYLSIDPIGLAGGGRTHGYVHNPMQMCDFLGL